MASNLSKKLKSIDAAIESAASQQPEETQTPVSMITVAEKREIIKTQAVALGLTLSTKEITQLLNETKKTIANDREEYVQVALEAIRFLIQKMELHSEGVLAEMADTIVDETNKSNERFAKKVEETFHQIGASYQESSQQSKQAITDFRSSLNSTISSLFD